MKPGMSRENGFAEVRLAKAPVFEARLAGVRLFVAIVMVGLWCGGPVHAQGQKPWQPTQQYIYWGQIERDEAGDPILHYTGGSYHYQTNARVSFILYKGQPAFKVWCSVYHMSKTGGGSIGGVVIAKDTVLYEVENGSKDYSSHDNIEVLRSEGEVKVSLSAGKFIDIHLKSGGKKMTVTVADFPSRNHYIETKNRSLYTFLNCLLIDFDHTAKIFENQAGLTDPEAQLSAAARFHGLTKEEIAANIAAREAEMKAAAAEEKARHGSEGGGGLTALTAILTGVAAGVSGQGNTPILDAGNKQAAAMRAIGNANAAKQLQASQALVAAQQQAAAQLAASQKLHSSVANSSKSAASSASNSAETVVEPQPEQAAGSSLVGGGLSSGGNSAASSPRYASPISPSCIRQFWDPQVYNWLSFENNCGVSINLNFIFNAPAGWAMNGSMILAPGAHKNSGLSGSDINKAGGFKYYVCPDGYIPVDGSDNMVTAAVAEFRCKAL